MSFSIDHLVYAVPDLAAAMNDIEQRWGVRPAFGGQHATGTHNALLALGPTTYLEIIALDPAQTDRSHAYFGMNVPPTAPKPAHLGRPHAGCAGHGGSGRGRGLPSRRHPGRGTAAPGRGAALLAQHVVGWSVAPCRGWACALSDRMGRGHASPGGGCAQGLSVGRVAGGTS